MSRFERLTPTALLRRIARNYDSLRYVRDRRLALLAAANVLDTMSVSLIVPLLPLYAERMGASPLLVGVMFAAETLAKALLSTPFGFLADRFDRRRLVAGGTVLSGVAVVALGLAATPLVFVALRLVDGAASAMRLPATRAYVGDQFPEEERGRAMGANRTMGMLGLALGPAVGGLLAAGTRLAVPFVVLGAGTIVAGLALAVGLPPVEGRDANDADAESVANAETADDESDPDDATDGKSDDASIRALWRRRREVASPTVVALGVTSAVAGFSSGAFSPLFPMLLDAKFAVGPGYMGATWSAFGAAMFLFTPVGGSLADRVGRKPSMVGGRTTWVAVYVGLAFAATPLVPPLLVFGGGIASALAGPAQGALNYDVAPEGFEATLVGVYGTLGSTGAALGPIVGGALAGRIGVEAAFVVLAALALVDAGVVAVGVRRR